MSVLSRSQQTLRVAFLGATFMIMFTAFNSLQNIVSKVYKEYGYDSLGETSILFLYFVFGVSTFFTPFVIRKYGFKKVMFVSSLGYAVYQGMGLIIALWTDMPHILGWILVLSGAGLCGASASMIWVAQSAYVNEVAGQERKTELFGLFWSLMMSSQIVGNLITTFVLGLIGNTIYFLVLTVLGFASAFLFILLPDIERKNTTTQKLTVKQEANKVIALIKDSHNRNLIYYFFFPGVTVGFYATFLYKLIALSLPQQSTQSDDDHNKRVSFYSGLVFIALGVSQALTGFLMNRFAQKYCKFKLAVTGTLLVEVAGFVSLLCYFLSNYALCFAVSFLWGSAETFLQTNTGALIGKLFPGKIQSYSAYRIIFSLGVVMTIVLNIALKGVPAWVFLTIVMAVQVFTNRISLNLSDMKVLKNQNGSESLLSDEMALQSKKQKF